MSLYKTDVNAAPVPDKAKQSAKLNAEVEAFLAAGGEIEELESTEVSSDVELAYGQIQKMGSYGW